MEYLKIGEIVNTFGLKGELKVNSFTDFEEERFKKGNAVYVKYDNGYEKHIISSFRINKGNVLISFEEYQDINLAEKYKTCEVYVDKAGIKPLEDGRFYFFELAGMDVVDDKRNHIGKVLEVIEGMANNNLRVLKDDGGTCLVPYVPAFIVYVDRNFKEIVIRVIEGLL